MFVKIDRMIGGTGSLTVGVALRFLPVGTI